MESTPRAAADGNVSHARRVASISQLAKAFGRRAHAEPATAAALPDESSWLSRPPDTAKRSLKSRLLPRSYTFSNIPRPQNISRPRPSLPQSVTMANLLPHNRPVHVNDNDFAASTEMLLMPRGRFGQGQSAVFDQDPTPRKSRRNTWFGPSLLMPQMKADGSLADLSISNDAEEAFQGGNQSKEARRLASLPLDPLHMHPVSSDATDDELFVSEPGTFTAAPTKKRCSVIPELDLPLPPSSESAGSPRSLGGEPIDIYGTKAPSSASLPSSSSGRFRQGHKVRPNPEHECRDADDDDAEQRDSHSFSKKQEIPVDPRDVYEAQSSAYWTGRFVSQKDRILNEGGGGYAKPVPRSAAGDAAPKLSKMERELSRARQIFGILDAHCKTDEARKSLMHFKQHYAANNHLPELAPDVFIDPARTSSSDSSDEGGAGNAQRSDAIGIAISGPSKTAFAHRKPAHGREADGHHVPSASSSSMKDLVGKFRKARKKTPGPHG